MDRLDKDLAPAQAGDEPVGGSARRPPDSARDPAWTKAQLLDAARAEFAAKGLSGARVNAIAAQAGVNKQLLYYYFGDKESLYAEVLARAYAEIRVGEQALQLDRLAPRAAMVRFIEFTFDYLIEHRDFVALLNDENTHQARHIKDRPQLRRLHKRLRATIGGITERGLADGAFRRAIDPVDLYISIASLCYFYLSNHHTLSAIFARDLMSKRQLVRRRRQIVDLVLCYLTTAQDELVMETP